MSEQDPIASRTSFALTLILYHITPFTLAPFSFLEHTKHALATRPLQLTVLSAWQALHSPISTAPSLTLFESLLQYQFILEPSLVNPYKITPTTTTMPQFSQLPYPPSIFFFLALISILFVFTIFTFVFVYCLSFPLVYKQLISVHLIS